MRFPPPGREGRLPGAGSRRDELPGAACARDGGAAEGAEDGQSDLRHPERNDAGNRRTGESDAAFKQIHTHTHTHTCVLKCSNGM